MTENIAYKNILEKIRSEVQVKCTDFLNYVDAVNGQSIFELNESELEILEYIRMKGRKINLQLLISKENPKNGEIVEILDSVKNMDSLSPDKLFLYKHTPYQYVVQIKNVG